MENKLNSNLFLAIVVAAFGSAFQHGYATGVVNLPEQILRNWQNITHKATYSGYMTNQTGALVWGCSTSMMNAGGTIGGLLTGVAVQTMGPKLSIILNNILVFIACALMSFVAHGVGSIEAFVVGRFLIGVNSGLNTGLCPMYLSEISPVAIRGAVSSVYQLVLTISILIAMVLGMNKVLGTEKHWMILFTVPIAVAIFQVVAMFFCADSPKYLLSIKGDSAKAEKALKWLRKSDNVDNEMALIKSEDDAIKNLPKVTLKEMFKNSKLRTPLIIAMAVMLAQQFSGINAIMFYSTESFKSGGLNASQAEIGSLILGTVNVLMTIVSVWLVEVAGRKTLLLVGFGGLAIDTAIVSVTLHFSEKISAMAWVSLGLLVIYIILFAAGAGSIPWFLVSEMFNQAARPTAVSLAVPTNWLANTIVTLMFPALKDLLKSWVFFIFTGLNVLFFLFIWRFAPETKNKTIEEITESFK